MATIIRGKEVAEQVLSQVKADVAALLARGVTPCLAVILVGDDPASHIYVGTGVLTCALPIWQEKREMRGTWHAFA